MRAGGDDGSADPVEASVRVGGTRAFQQQAGDGGGAPARVLVPSAIAVD